MPCTVTVAGPVFAFTVSFLTSGVVVLPAYSQECIVQSVSADGYTVTLALPLKYTHWGADGMFAEVGQLTRHIKFQGQPADASDPSEVSFGGHIMVTMSTFVEVVGIEATQMGQQGILARYRTWQGRVRCGVGGSASRTERRGDAHKTTRHLCAQGFTSRSCVSVRSVAFHFHHAGNLPAASVRMSSFHHNNQRYG